jgi:hypothetical protein
MRIANRLVTEFDCFYPAFGKPIIDEIDCVLARHYGFTEEELDFMDPDVAHLGGGRHLGKM